ncbi:MAG: MFS transporter, partial [Anaerolineae bacterium]|nr:MFS transporter [Anaerolineae bacterium]
LAAPVWGILIDKFGRRKGSALGLIFGALGSALIVMAANQSLLLLMLGGMLFVGFAQSAMLLGRFAAAEVNPPTKRGGAIANVVLGGTFGAIVGPLLVAPMALFALSLGMDELAGGYIAGLILMGFASLTIFFGLRPDPREIGKEVAALYPDSAPEGEARPIGVIFRQPAALIAVTAMVIGQVVMIAIMVITSLHMKGNDHGLGSISAVISAHTVGMFAFSVVSGRLADKWGRAPVILTGAAILVLACFTAPLSSNVFPIAVSLFLLGLGWNFCFVGGSTLLADQLSQAERARTQGVNDLLVGLASATGSLGSGLVYAATSYTVISLVGGGLSLIPLGMALTWILRKKTLVGA